MGCADIGYISMDGVSQHHSFKPPNGKTAISFVLSAGHGSMWQYALLHLSGFNLTFEAKSKISDNSAAKLLDTQNTVTPKVLKPPQVHWVKVARTL
jgi:hypothetical protein